MKYIKLYLFVTLLIVSCKSVQEQVVSVQNASIQEVDTREIQGGMWIPSLLEGMNETESKISSSLRLGNEKNKKKTDAQLKIQKNIMKME